MRVICFVFFQSKPAFNINTCHLIPNISQLRSPVSYWQSWNYYSKSIVFYFLGEFGQLLWIWSRYEDVILRRSHNCAGTAFVQWDSAGDSNLTEQTLISWIYTMTWLLTLPYCSHYVNFSTPSVYIHFFRGKDKKLMMPLNLCVWCTLLILY